MRKLASIRTMGRKLASIRIVGDIREIENAQNIEVVLVDGWEVVAKKGDFKTGDKCVYIEIDSIVPAKPEFEFLEKRRYRVRTIRLRKQVSQGIVFKPEDVGISDKYPVGKDITEELGVIKYDPQAKKEARMREAELQKKSKFVKWMMRFGWFRVMMKGKRKNWPEWIAKTDETRIQNVPSYLVRHADAICYATEKMDGSSASYSLKKMGKFLWFKDLIFTVCSRNMWLKRTQQKFKNDKFEFDSNNYWAAAKKYNLEIKLRELDKELVIQGEILGEGIQKNKYKIKPNDIKLRVYNIYDIKRDVWLGANGIKTYCKALGLEMVPVVWTGRLKDLGTTVPEVVEKSKGKSLLNPKIHREGIVIRQILAEEGKRGLSFKAINPDFLLKYDDE